MAGIQIIFKLFDITKREFDPGFLCALCHDLVAQVEHFEYQLKMQMEPEIIEAEPVEASRESISSLIEACLDDSKAEGQDNRDERLTAPGPESKQEMHGSGLWPQSPGDCPESLAEGEAPVNVSLRPKGARKSRTPKEYNLCPENLDFDVSTALSNSDRDLILYRGYKFYAGIRSYPDETEQSLKRWRCRQKQCGSALVTYMNMQCVLKDTTSPHNHGPIPVKSAKLAFFQQQMKQIIAEHPTMESRAIFSAAQLLCPGIPVVYNDSMMRFIQRVRRRKSQPSPGRCQRPELQPNS
eukprot:maker-scaffold64_size435223-snap-gene-3.14 protein:Tk02506 transcript:maker-scaffold64_size435223-snap-gene-3.14-mRNA-1 annotation:"hypothetical protein H311_01827"